jgi:hypothetical protein
MKRKCQICGSIVDQQLPEKVERACLEVRLSDGSVADVALMVEGRPEAAIEIKVTHEVDEAKASRLTIPFIEVDGYEVLENPQIWRPLQDAFRPLTCTKCLERLKVFQTKAASIARQGGMTLPASFYRYAFCRCWKCNREIVVFTWPGRDMHSDRPPNQQPVPKTIQYRFSKTVGHKYWANTCPYCHSIQGDSFLYLEPGAPFFALQDIDDAPDAFKHDLMKIAAYAEYNGSL